MLAAVALQEELAAAGYVKAAVDAGLAAKGAAKGRKAAKKGSGASASSLQGFRTFTSPGGLQARQ
jgi:hypothetical protein